MSGAKTTIRLVSLLAMAALFGGGYAVVAYTRHIRNRSTPVVPVTSTASTAEDVGSVELSARTAELARIKTSEALISNKPRSLDLRGSLAINPNRLAHVHARFPGQIVQLATVEGGTGEPEKSEFRKPLGFMDHVTKAQDLAVLWSKDLGEKKSELVDALARLRIDALALSRLEELYKRGSTTEQSVRAAELQVELDQIASRRAERTLRSWMLTDEEIDAVRDEAARLSKHEDRKTDADSGWARLDIVAPIDGTIVEKNVTIGDIVDTNADLFKIADLSVLNVWLHAYEEDLPYLQNLGTPIPTQIRLPSNPELGPLTGTIERIGDIIDPNEHMALLIGSIDNSKGVLRAGQFITASVEIPPEQGVVEIPAKALIDDDNESFVFVQSDPEKLRYTRRRVSVSRRYFDVVFVRSVLDERERKAGMKELHAGERVVSSGISQLEEILESRQASDEKAH